MWNCIAIGFSCVSVREMDNQRGRSVEVDQRDGQSKRPVRGSDFFANSTPRKTSINVHAQPTFVATRKALTQKVNAVQPCFNRCFKRTHKEFLKDAENLPVTLSLPSKQRIANIVRCYRSRIPCGSAIGSLSARGVGIAVAPPA